MNQSFILKSLLSIILAAGLLFSCQKKAELPQFQEVSFKALKIIPISGSKSTANWECKDIIPTNAWVIINDEDYFPELFEVDGALFMQALKLPVLKNGQYCVTAFVLYMEGNDTPGYQAEPVGDEIVSGTPQPGSDYEVYINEAYRFPYCFAVTAFAKAEIPIEVLCYQDADYSEFGCETAFAYNVDYSECFLDLTIINADRWGWTNGPLAQNNIPYSFEIYAAAGQCNLDAGTLVGTLTLLYVNDEAVVTYSMDAGFSLDEVHIYVGNDILPKKKNGSYTEAPGQYPHVAENLNGVTSYSYTFDNITGDVYLIAHAVVCGYY